jgi:GntR family transcriptional regulator
MSFTEDMRTRGLTATSRVLRCSPETADATVAAQLDLPIGARVVFLERVRLADGEPMAIERVYLPYDRFGGLLGQDLAQRSLYDLLEQEFDCRPSLADETVEAILLNAADARLLGVPRNSPALMARRITRDDRGAAVESVQTLYRGDRYRMVFTRKR